MCYWTRRSTGPVPPSVSLASGHSARHPSSPVAVRRLRGTPSCIPQRTSCTTAAGTLSLCMSDSIFAVQPYHRSRAGMLRRNLPFPRSTYPRRTASVHDRRGGGQYKYCTRHNPCNLLHLPHRRRTSSRPGGSRRNPLPRMAPWTSDPTGNTSSAGRCHHHQILTLHTCSTIPPRNRMALRD